jgi:predicted molibdopterin-dependent oxidoreductase YjgC
MLCERNLSRIRTELEAFTPESVEDRTGVPAKLLREEAKKLTAGRRLAVIPGSGIARGRGALFSGSLLALMTMIAGEIGGTDSGIFPIAFSLNDQGALDMGACFDRLPGHRMAAEPGMDYATMMEAARRGTLRGLYVVGENPLRDCPDAQAVREALSRLDLLVVQDLFLTETARLAHVVLPSASFAEKTGTFTNLERRVVRFRRAIEPLGESRPDGAILADLMGRMGHAAPPHTPEDVLAEINEQVPAYRGITPRRLEREPEGIFWPCPDEEDPGTPLLYAGRSPQVPEEAVLDSSPALALASQDDAYPLSLLTAASLFHSADGVRTSHSRILLEACPEGFLTMNPFDAGPLGIAEGAAATVRSPAGSIRARVRMSEEVPRGVVVATPVGEMAPEGLCSIDARDPGQDAPALQPLAVRVEVEHAGT